jgi:transposase
LSIKRVGWSERPRWLPNRMRSFASFKQLRVATFGLVSKLDRYRNGCVTGTIDAGLPVVCVEACHAKAAMAAMNRNKNDRNDARSLAQMVRSGWFKAVHVKSRLSQELRTLLTAREFYVNKLRDHENEIRGLLRLFGLKVATVGTRDFEVRVRELVAGNPLMEL